METRLIKLLEGELELFELIHEQTIKQTELLVADNTTEIEKSLDIRQELIEKINGLHQESEPLMQSYLLFSGAPGGKNNPAIDAAGKKLRAIIAECHAKNEKNMSSVHDKSNAYTKRITELGVSKKGIGAYIQSVPNDAELFDKKT